jgi:hypothetical protein
MLSNSQKRFIGLFVLDGERDFVKTCAQLGIRPSEARGWFAEDGFKRKLRDAEWSVMLASGYGPMATMNDTLAIAHSDISQVACVGGDLSQLPRNVRIAIKKVRFGVAVTPDGKAVTYPKEVEMHPKEWALKQAAEWFGVAETPEAKQSQATTGEDGPKRISGLIVRPPLTREDKEIEDILK